MFHVTFRHPLIQNLSSKCMFLITNGPIMILPTWNMNKVNRILIGIFMILLSIWLIKPCMYGEWIITTVSPHCGQLSRDVRKLISSIHYYASPAGRLLAVKSKAGDIALFILPLIINSLRNTLRPEFGIFYFCQCFCQIAAGACLRSCNWWRNRRNPYFSFGNSFNEKKISEHTDIPATTHLGLPNICINSSKSLANIYEIDK